MSSAALYGLTVGRRRKSCRQMSRREWSDGSTIYRSQRDVLLKVYQQALKALDIPQGDIRRDYLSGMWLEAQGTYRAKGMAAADAEDRADYLIEQIFAAMENGTAWLRHRITVCERL